MDANQHCLLRANNLTKVFPGVMALNGVNFQINAGEVNALVGENGAGKSTLIKIIAGFYTPDSGEIKINGEDPFLWFNFAPLPATGR